MKTVNHIGYRFYKQPFVLLFLLLAAGIIFSAWFGYSNLISFSLLLTAIVFTVLVYLGRLSGSFFLVGLIPVFVLMGMYLYQEKSGQRESRHFKDNYSSGNGLIGEVSEFKSGQSDWSRGILRVQAVLKRGKSVPVSATVLFYVKNSSLQLEEGDRLLMAAELSAISNRNNPGEFNAEAYWKNKGIAHMAFLDERELRLIEKAEPTLLDRWIKGTRNYLNTVVEQYFSGAHESVIKAVILGDKSRLDQETRTTFGNSGAMHVLAVSGLHVGIFLVILLYVFQRASRFISRNAALIIIVLILWFYALITGFSPSVVRAVFMFSVLAIAQLTSRNFDPINVLFLAAFVVLLFAPQQLFDIGFQLSYAAMLGIFLFYNRIEPMLSFKFWLLRKAWQGTAVGLAAQLMTIPLTLGYFHQFPNYFILSNLGLMLFSGFLLGFGLVLFVVKSIPLLNQLIAFSLFSVVYLLLGFLGWIENLPGAVAYGYSIGLFQGLFLLGSIFLLFWNFGRTVFKIAGSVVLVITIVSIVFDRFERMEAKELCIFNSNKVIIAVKTGQHIHCFHNAQEDDIEKVERVITDYARLYPADVSYHSIHQMETSLKGEELNASLKFRKGFYELAINEYKFYLTTNYEAPQLPENAKMIHMPWVKNGNGFSLNDGAFRLSLN